MLDINMICAGCMNPNETDGDCPVCGCSRDYQNGEAYLPVRYFLYGRYIIGRVLSVTCESVIYIAYDNTVGKTVNLKEYFPEGVAVRAADKSVCSVQGRENAYREGCANFAQLNEKLLPIDLPALPGTRFVFKSNNTVYAVTDPIIGITLKEFLKRNEGKLKWEQARPLFLPLIDTLNELNKQGIVHGGISPESIYVGRDGRLIIRDILINSARRYSRDMSAQIYGGYAAIEQYEPQRAALGSYTDVYGISATLFRVLIGNVPADAVRRVQNDTLSIPSHFAGELPRQVLVAMANGLQVLPENRTETVERFRDELVYGEIDKEDEGVVPVNVKPSKADKKKNKQKEMPDEYEKGSKGGNVKVALITALCTVLVFAIVAAVLVLGPFKDVFFKKETTPEKPQKGISSMSSSSEDASSGDYEPTFTVPDFTGRTYAQITESDEFKHFKFSIDKKIYSSKARGTVCEQSVKAGEEVTDKTEIVLSISLGPKEFEISDITGLTKDEALLQLLKQGILFDNIEVVEMYDSDSKPGVILKQEPAGKSTVTDESRVKIFVNSYDGEDEEEED